MHIDHIAIWTNQLEELREFYERYFGTRAGNKYNNPAKRFASYLMSFPDGAKLEIMTRADITDDCIHEPGEQYPGYIHVAISTGSKQAVDTLTAQIQHDGYRILEGPRHTGDGCYESVVLDPDGNRVEITV